MTERLVALSTSLPMIAPVAQPVSGLWRLYPQITGGVLALTVLYFVAIGPLRRRYGWGAPATLGQQIRFVLAMVILFSSLQGPLDQLGEAYLFSAHMVQHLLLTLVVPPLILTGLPTWVFDVPLQLPLLRSVGARLTQPIVAYAIFNVVFVGWHVPALYEAALNNQAIHAFEHVTFLTPALITWWPVFSLSAVLPRLFPGVQVLYLFLQSIPSTILGAIITFATSILYPTYSVAPLLVGVGPLTDQRSAGLIMWFGGGAVILGLITLRFFQWIGVDEDGREAAEA